MSESEPNEIEGTTITFKKPVKMYRPTNVVEGTVITQPNTQSEQEEPITVKESNCAIAYTLIGFYMVMSMVIILAVILIPNVSLPARASISVVASLIFLAALLHLWFVFQSYVLTGRC